MSDLFQLDQVLCVNRLETLRNSMVLDGNGSNVRIITTLLEPPTEASLNQIRSAVRFVQDFPTCSPVFADNFTCGRETETKWIQPALSVEYSDPAWFNLVENQSSAATVDIECVPPYEYSNLYLPNVDWTIDVNGDIIVLEAIPPETAFDLSHELVHALDTMAAYVSESERRACGLLKRFLRKLISSCSVSKNGHLGFLAGYRRVRIETAARDQVVHLEVITLAEEHEEAPVSSAVGQILTFGEEVCKRMKRSCWNLFSGCSEKSLYFGSISVGLSDVVA